MTFTVASVKSELIGFPANSGGVSITSIVIRYGPVVPELPVKVTLNYWSPNLLIEYAKS